MLWLYLIPFALGILLSPELPLEKGWLCLSVALLTLLAAFIHRRGGSISLLVLVNALLLGTLYGEVRDVQNDTNGYAQTSVVHEVNPAVVRMEETLATTGLTASHRALLSAMLMGDRRGLSQTQKVYFRRAGVQHLLALSGLHLGILLAIVSIFLLRWVRFTRWQWPVLLITLFLMWMYAYVVGCPKSLLRATLMSSLFLVGRSLHRNAHSHEVLASAVLLMLLLDPQSVTNIGAQLSVAALVGLTCFYPILRNFALGDEQEAWRNTNFDAPFYKYCLKDIFRKLFTAFLVSLSAWLFTMPIVLVYFHQIQLWSPLVSIVLIPLTSLVLYAAVLLFSMASVGLPMLVSGMSSVVEWLMSVQDWCVATCAHLPLSSIDVEHTSWWQVADIYLVMMVLYAVVRQRSFKVILFSVPLLLLLSALLLWLS